MDLDAVNLTCLASSTRRTARAVSRHVNSVLRPIDLTVGQFGLLAAIAKNPDSNLREISDRLLLEESTMTRNLAVLERRRLVEAEGGRGRGGKRVRLTDAGVAITHAGATLWAKANNALAEQFSPDALEAGRGFLEALSAAAERLGDDPADPASD